MLIIATDEAGYGPKLGPLVVCATAWTLQPDAAQFDEIDACFAPLRQPTQIGCETVPIDDSKAVFQPGKKNALAKLHAAVSACNHWWGFEGNDTGQLIASVASQDAKSIGETPWLKHLSKEPFLSSDATSDALKSWQSASVNCLAVKARVVTAKRFNEFCDGGANKADLLSEMTLGLVRDLIDQFGSAASSAQVFCDRHGGRRYYTGIVQHVFPDSLVTIRDESKQQSVYGFEHSGLNSTIHFTVKGDRFTPVAMSSMVAKYLRERLVESLNTFFQQHHQQPEPFQPTAGYPVDADRFLKMVAPTLKCQSIPMNSLVPATIGQYVVQALELI